MGLGIAALLALAPVTAAPPSPPPIESDAEAWAADARVYAERYRVPLPEALRRLRLQEASVAASDALAAEWAPRLAGILVEHAPDWRLVVVLTGTQPVPPRVMPIAGDAVPVAFRTGARATRAALLAAIAAHQVAIREALATPPALAPDPATGTLLILTPVADLPEDDRSLLAQQLADIAGMPVTIHGWSAFGRDLAVEAGGRLRGVERDGRRYVCTSGFAVFDGTSAALSTAAHCPDMLEFVDRDRGATPLTMIGAWGARSQDVQLHAAPVPLAPTLRGDDLDRPRTVTSWRTRASTRAGDFVCHRGERTGYSCAEVRFPDFAPPGDLCYGNCPATWVAVAGPSCRSGDSGGPVFAGTVAFGLTKGGSYVADGACRLYYYMSVDYLPQPWRVMVRGDAASRLDPATK